jgi:retron-type reverse transcriptase
MTNQLELPFAATENSAVKTKEVYTESDGANLIPSETDEAPKAKVKREKRWSATMERVTERLGKAWSKVASNKGKPGPDGKTIEEVRENLTETFAYLKTSLIAGDYVPGKIRRVFIPKSGGKGERGLGIPNVEDRIVQEAVRQVLQPLWEPVFHECSHGFRPGRSCHTAIKVGQGCMESGHEWVVD